MQRAALLTGRRHRPSGFGEPADDMHARTLLHQLGDHGRLFSSDGAAVEVQNILGQRVVVPSNGNLALAQGMIEQLASGDDLTSLRSRASGFRPLTVVRQMEADAQKQYFGKIKELEDELQQTTEKMQKLQMKKKSD